jgi:hypothetical protein
VSSFQIERTVRNYTSRVCLNPVFLAPRSDEFLHAMPGPPDSKNLKLVIDSALWMRQKGGTRGFIPPVEIAERILLIVGAILYFVPTVIAWRLGVKSVQSIFYVNLIFGWTIVGWVFAMIWVMTERNELPTNPLS